MTDRRCGVLPAGCRAADADALTDSTRSSAGLDGARMGERGGWRAFLCAKYRATEFGGKPGKNLFLEAACPVLEIP